MTPISITMLKPLSRRFCIWIFLEAEEETWSTEQMIDTGFEFPQSITDMDQALQALEQSLTLRGKTIIARSEVQQMAHIYFTLLEYVQLSLDLVDKDSELFKALAKGRELRDYTPEDAVMELLKTLKTQLADNFQLRVVSS